MEGVYNKYLPTSDWGWQQGGREGQRDQHGHQDRERGDPAHERQEGDAGDRQADQRDHHGHACEGHGRAGSARGQADGLRDLRAAAQLGAVAVEQEQEKCAIDSVRYPKQGDFLVERDQVVITE